MRPLIPLLVRMYVAYFSYVRMYLVIVSLFGDELIGSVNIYLANISFVVKTRVALLERRVIQ